MSPTIKQVAERAGVSMSTVSHVLNGTHYVSPHLTQRVLAAVNELGYRQNPIARILAGGRSRVVGVLVPELFNTYAGEIIRGIDDELLVNDYEMMLYTTRRGKHLASTYASTFASGLVTGMVIIVPQDLNDFTRSLDVQQIPHVVIDPEIGGNHGVTVSSTNWQGAYDATRYLIELGHQRIGFITGAMFLECANDRLAGYKAALDDSNLPFQAEYIAEGDFLQPKAYMVANQLLDLPTPPTAIFASNDYTAFGVIEAARSRGIKVPEDLSVVGFDDTPQAAAMRPGLTSVRQSLVEMGRRAARLLLQYIQQPDAPPNSICLPTEFIIRESCQSPQASPDSTVQTRTKKGVQKGDDIRED